jgi:hypothetical protein
LCRLGRSRGRWRSVDVSFRSVWLMSWRRSLWPVDAQKSEVSTFLEDLKKMYEGQKKGRGN